MTYRIARSQNDKLFDQIEKSLQYNRKSVRGDHSINPHRTLNNAVFCISPSNGIYFSNRVFRKYSTENFVVYKRMAQKLHNTILLD